jgi:uncharacterized protein
MPKKGDMTTREAGALGGAKVREKYGKEFFSRIGREGRAKAVVTIQARYGDDYYKKIGSMGGARMSELIRKGKALEEGDAEK